LEEDRRVHEISAEVFKDVKMLDPREAALLAEDYNKH
jgi:hypothetical protein